MESQGVIFKKDSPRFDGRNYIVWKNRMEVHLKCLGDEGDTDEESEGDKVFISIKEDGHVPIDSTSYSIEEKALVAKVEEKSVWVIDSGCSHHMTGDKRKLVSMEKYDDGIVRFGDDKANVIRGRGSISFDGKHNIDDVLYAEV
ncbi:hypothetical protein SUGI_0621380 [Cryptomeria japonica]|nr:hypothetical protein SUGI_0621380 [Cryptomeria japonica]